MLVVVDKDLEVEEVEGLDDAVLELDDDLGSRLREAREGDQVLRLDVRGGKRLLPLYSSRQLPHVEPVVDHVVEQPGVAVRHGIDLVVEPPCPPWAPLRASVPASFLLLQILELEHTLVWLHLDVLGTVEYKHLGVCTDDLQLELLFCIRRGGLWLGGFTATTAQRLGRAQGLGPCSASSLS